MIRFNTIQIRIVGLGLIISIVPFLIFLFITVDQITESMIEVFAKELEARLELASQQVDAFIQQRMVDAKILSKADVLEGNNLEAIQKYLEEIDLEDPWISIFEVFDLTGKRLVSTHVDQIELMNNESLHPFIFPNTVLSNAVDLMNQMRLSFSNIVHFDEEHPFQCTFSCGIAAFPEFDSAMVLNEEADKALYLAKENGRNRVEVANKSHQ